MIRIRQIKIRVDEDSKELLEEKIVKRLKIREKIQQLKIVKKSIDARRKDEIFYVYDVDVAVNNESIVLAKNKELEKAPNEKYCFPHVSNEAKKQNVVIVGSGPAGLFCAYVLLENGIKPIVIERGADLEDRVKDVEHFWAKGELDVNSNVQFGLGGAGTFSDGKLNTLVKDKLFRGKKVLEIFVENGAPEEILYVNKPHIGTDLLRTVIKNMYEKMVSMGCIFHFHSLLTDIVIENCQVKEIEINNEYFLSCDKLVLAIGHSARDTFELLYQKGFSMESKPFAVGVRIEQKQKDIQENQYGKFANILPPADYKLTYTTSQNRGVYTFCMCPGGFVVNASSEKNRLAINGMSNYMRDEENANSAVIVTVNKDDFGTHPLDGIRFQRDLESKAYQYANGLIPTQTYSDFVNNQITEEYGKIAPVHKGKTIYANLNDILPDFICDALKEAIPNMALKMPSFVSDAVLLSAIESRTSSPVRILRNECCESNIRGIYPCGEGAGYAGGITTSAMDGIKVAEQLI